MAVGPKAAAFAAFFRVFTTAMPELAPTWEMLLSIVAVVTMFVGNLGAIMQTNIKRLLAYSSISHAGYILIAIIAKGSLATSALLFYMLAYTFMTFGAFSIVILIGRKGKENLELEDYSGLGVQAPLLGLAMAIFPNLALEDYSGLGFQAPLLGLAMSIFLLSLGGLPPLAGFVGKFYIFQAALNEGYVVLVVLAVLNSAISLYYYLRVIVFMYMKEPKGEFQISLTPITLLVIIIGVLGTIQLGLFPDPVISLAHP